MASYHITDNGPRACSTTPDRCPYGREGGDHFDNVAEAQVSYEHIMENKHGLFGLVEARGRKQTDLFRLYERMDRLHRDPERAKQIVRIANYSRSAPSKENSGAFLPSGRTRGYDRMRKNHPGRRISKMATRDGRQLFEGAGQTPENVIRIKGYLTNRPKAKAS